MLFSEEFIQAFGWTIIHSLWQATLIAAILVLFMRKLKSASALSRYWAAVATLAAVSVISIFTFTQVYERNEDHFLDKESSTQIFLYGEQNYSFVIENEPIGSAFLDAPIAHWSSFLENQLPFISMLWVVGVLFFSMRFGFGLLEIERLRRTKNFALDKEWEARLKSLAGRIRILENIQLRESILTNVPIALGHFKPMILLPIGTINALPID
ncbi:MAG: M56 family metallopeptidase, partial [Bacteroidota bacterium]